jgi:hypothetical protein
MDEHVLPGWAWLVLAAGGTTLAVVIIRIVF